MEKLDLSQALDGVVIVQHNREFIARIDAVVARYVDEMSQRDKSIIDEAVTSFPVDTFPNWLRTQNGRAVLLNDCAGLDPDATQERARHVYESEYVAPRYAKRDALIAERGGLSSGETVAWTLAGRPREQWGPDPKIVRRALLLRFIEQGVAALEQAEPSRGV